MKRATQCFLTLSGVTGLIGVIALLIHELTGGAICALAFVFLLLAYVCEKLSPKPIRYRRNELSARKISMGTMETGDTTLWVSSVTAFSGRRTCAEVGRVDGIYAIELEEKFNGDVCLVSKVRVRLEGYQKRGFQRNEHSIVVDTGWLCFLTTEGRIAWSDKRLDTRIMEELKNPKGFPLQLWLENESGSRVGFVISTGEGDDVYDVKTGSVDGRIVSLAIQFM